MNFEAGKIYMIAEKLDGNSETDEDGFNRDKFLQEMIDDSLQYFSAHRIIEEVYFEYCLHQERISSRPATGRFETFTPFVVLLDCKESFTEYQSVLILQTEDGDSSMGYLKIKPLYMRPQDRTKYELYELII